MSLRTVIVAAVFALVAPVAQGQNTSRISGEVKDPEGKPIAKARVTFTHGETNFAYDFTTDARGRFFSAGLRLGGFKIRAEADGFMPFDGETKVLPASSPDFSIVLQKKAEAPADARAAEAARLAFAAGDLAAAAQHYEEFLALHPEDVETRFNLGIVYTRAKEFGKAAEALAKVVAVKPEMSDAWRLLANAYVETKQFDEARAALEKFVAAKPENVDALLDLGTLYFNADQGAKAVQLFERAAKAGAADPETEFLLGNAYFKVERYPEAILHLETFVTAKPGSVDGHYLLGNAYVASSKMREALAEFKTFLTMAPDHADAPRVRLLVAELEKMAAKPR